MKPFIKLRMLRNAGDKLFYATGVVGEGIQAVRFVVKVGQSRK